MSIKTHDQCIVSSLMLVLPLHSTPLRLAVLEDAWGAEADFQAARHRLLLSLCEAYRHAADWGPATDLFAGINNPHGPKPFSPPSTSPVGAVGAGGGGGGGGGSSAASARKGGGEGVGGLWGGVGVNSAQPELLGARRALRREVADLFFRCDLVFLQYVGINPKPLYPQHREYVAHDDDWAGLAAAAADCVSSQTCEVPPAMVALNCVTSREHLFVHDQQS